MTTPEQPEKEPIRRLKELGYLSRQRYLEAGGNPRLSVGSLNSNDRLTAPERQEFLELLRRVVTDEEISSYQKTPGTGRDR